MQTKGLPLFWSSTGDHNFAKTTSPDLEVSHDSLSLSDIYQGTPTHFVKTPT